MMRLAYVRLLVADFPAAFRFYRDVLGFKPLFGDENDVYTEFDGGGLTIALFRKDLMAEVVGATDQPATAESQDEMALIFAVENVDTACKELQARGVALVTEPQDRAVWGIRTAHFRDTDGNLIEIFNPIPA
jgi:catechol 2,3-dioxygenase-like lactoylglutathione lyase family enzyme